MSGGAGGAMADAFVNLGDLLHKNFSANMNSAFQNRQSRNALEENKRQFDINALLKKREMMQDQDQYDRSTGMSAINMLAKQRQDAMANFQNAQFKNTAKNLLFRGV